MEGNPSENPRESINLGLCRIDLTDMENACEQVRKLSRGKKFSYVVTPNISHMELLYREEQHGDASRSRPVHEAFSHADLSYCDSRILRLMLGLLGVRLRQVITGSDLTRMLLEKIVAPQDRIMIVGGTRTGFDALRARFPQLQFYHCDVQPGFYDSPLVRAAVIESIAAAACHYVFFVLSSPVKEQLARDLQESECPGVGLCTGAAIQFVTGEESRAPRWMQGLALEWLFRMLQKPRQLCRRYLSNAVHLIPIGRRIYPAVRLSKSAVGSGNTG